MGAGEGSTARSVIAVLLASALALAAGCDRKTAGTGGDAGASDSGSGSGGDPGCLDGCNSDPSIACSAGATGIACCAGDNPEHEDPSLSCSTPQTNAGEDDFCCFENPGGFTCTPDDTLASVCPPGPDSYGYQCVSGDDPTTLDASLVCSTPTSDADGVHDDYCCTYTGTSAGLPPTGCIADANVVCAGGADGYACATGADPETEDPHRSCSTPAPVVGGADYCCFTDDTWSSTTCEPDDHLTSVCPDPMSYGYQCDTGLDPMTLDASLRCSTPTPDADGVHDDYCCTFG